MPIIGTNIGSNYASLTATNVNERLSVNQRRLASGSRLARPSDDAAGVAVSGNLDAALKRLEAASEGTRNVISAASNTDGFLSTIQSQVTRLSELAALASNGAFGSAERAAYQTEFNNITNAINTVANNATFNGTPLFTNSSISTSINADGSVDSLTLSTLGTTASLGINGLNISTTAGATAAIATLNTAISSVTNRRATVNAEISKFNFYTQNTLTEKNNVAAANGRIKDLNVADETTSLAANNILLRSSYSVLSQSNSNQRSILALLR